MNDFHHMGFISENIEKAVDRIIEAIEGLKNKDESLHVVYKGDRSRSLEDQLAEATDVIKSQEKHIQFKNECLVELNKALNEAKEEHRITHHSGDCTIWACLVNGEPTDGICTCGYGLLRKRNGWFGELYSAERGEAIGRSRPTEKACDNTPPPTVSPTSLTPENKKIEIAVEALKKVCNVTAEDANPASREAFAIACTALERMEKVQ